MSESAGNEARLVAGRYRLIRALGRGGMGAVWQAMDELLGREVAVKEVLLPPNLSQAEKATLCERTLREARTAARISHPSVVRIYDVVQDGGRPWIVMELVQSVSLADVINRDGPLAADRVASIGLDMLGALDAAHHAGVLHRDVKPSNVLLADDGRTVLTDFGIATLEGDTQLTSTGMVVGSPEYIAPERARGQQPGPAADLWSLGATLYAAVEGHSPYVRSGPLPTLSAVMTDDPDPMHRAGPLGPVLAGLLVKDPAARMSPAEARQALRGVIAAAGGDPGPTLTTPMPSAARGVTAATPQQATPQSATPQQAGGPVAGTAAVPRTGRTGFGEAPTELGPTAGPQPTAVMPGQRGPHPVTPPGSFPPPGAVPPSFDSTPPRRRRTPVWIAVGVVVVVAVAIALVLAKGNGRKPNNANPPASAGTSGAPSAAASADAGALPAGWQRQTNQASGITYALPPGFTVQNSTSRRGFDLLGPAGTDIRISITYISPAPVATALQWVSAQSALSRQRDITYQQEGIRQVSYRGASAVDWEFGWRAAGQPRSHGIERVVILSANGTPTLYAIELASPQADFDQAKAQYWEPSVEAFLQTGGASGAPGGQPAADMWSRPPGKGRPPADD